MTFYGRKRAEENIGKDAMGCRTILDLLPVAMWLFADEGGTVGFTLGKGLFVPSR